MSFQRVRALVPVRHDNVLRIPGVTTGENAQDFVVRVAQATRMIELGLVSFIEAADPPATGLEQVFVDSAGTLRRPGGGVVGGGSSGPGVYSAMIAAHPTRDKTTQFLDVSGNLAHMVPEAGNTGAWATPGYMSSIAATNGGITMAAGRLNWTPAGESLLWMGAFNTAFGGANVTVLGVGHGAAANRYGFYLSARTPSGRVKVIPVANGAADLNISDTITTVIDGTQHTIAVLWDCVNRQWSAFVDGVLERQYTSPAGFYPDGVLAAPGGGTIRLGGTPGATASIAANLAGQQVYKWTGSPPLGVARAVATHAEMFRVPLTAGDF